jgi:predicted SnoaL-like aldol condensation-catalyzing enzyme
MEFVHEFFVQGLVKEPLDAFVSSDYIQHNPYILSGRNNTITALSPGGAFDFSTAKTTILHVLFDSPFAMVHYKVEFPGQPPTAITDIWRFNGTCIVEHWDVIQALPANASNPLALF